MDDIILYTFLASTLGLLLLAFVFLPHEKTKTPIARSTETSKRNHRQDYQLRTAAQIPERLPTGIDELTLCKRAGEKRVQNKLTEAITIYLQVIRLQLPRYYLRESSPSREAFNCICEILGTGSNESLPSISHLSAWEYDLHHMHRTIELVARNPEWSQRPTAIYDLQVLADYIVKWYGPEALGFAEVLYCRILIKISESKFRDENTYAHVVAELVKIYF
ncbi:hypothetical protein F4805DRAFT_453391 [Annulohypoxylon moriforme]|nr:hypothetical protein F4805DRAFT_453391 [Annulohypoxylon moriforme]